MKDSKTWAALTVFLAFIILFILLFKRKPVTAVAFQITQPGFEGQQVENANALNAALVRICHYSSRDIVWPLNLECAPKYEGETLTGDEIIRRL